MTLSLNNSNYRLLVDAVKKGNRQVISDIQRVTGRDGYLPESHQALTGELFQFVFPKNRHHEVLLGSVQLTSDLLYIAQSTWEWLSNHRRKRKGEQNNYLKQLVNSQSVLKPRLMLI